MPEEAADATAVSVPPLPRAAGAGRDPLQKIPDD